LLDSGEEEQKMVEAPVVVKPKIELNENNLLSGFMMEFGFKTTTNNT
jgi:hypothetical protein